MIYIHGLSQLSPKTVGIESVPIIREIKRNIAFPVSNERVKEHFSPFFVYKADTDIMEKSLSLVNPTILEIRSLLGKNDSDFEAINLNRAWKMLEEVSTPLRNNIAFSKEITEWQDSFIGEAANIFNNLRRLKIFAASPIKLSCHSVISLEKAILFLRGVETSSNIFHALLRFIASKSESFFPKRLLISKIVGLTRERDFSIISVSAL